MLGNAEVTASTTGLLAPEMNEVTRTMGALLRIRSVDTGKVGTVRNKNCKPRPHATADSDEEGEEAKKGGAAAPQTHAAVAEANVAVL